MKDKFEEDLQDGIENYGRTGYEAMANIDRLHKQVGFIIFLMTIAKVFNNHNSYVQKHKACSNKFSGTSITGHLIGCRKRMENYAEILGNIMQK